MRSMRVNHRYYPPILRSLYQHICTVPKKYIQSYPKPTSTNCPIHAIPSHLTNSIPSPSFTSTIPTTRLSQSHRLLRKHHPQHHQEPRPHLRHLRNRRLHRFSRTPPQVILSLRSAFPLGGYRIEAFVSGVLVLGPGGGVVEVLKIGLCGRLG